MRRRAAGFSLIEAMIATMILGFGLVGMTKAITAALTSGRIAELHTRAVLLAEEQMERIRLEPFLEAGEQEGDFGEVFPGFRGRAAVRETADEGLFEVALTVSRTRGDVRYELTTLVFVPPGSAAGGSEAGSGPRPAAAGGGWPR